MSYIEQIDKTRIPQHVAIIMDGNGRWAKQRGKERTYGHHAGAETVQKITEDAARLGSSTYFPNIYSFPEFLLVFFCEYLLFSCTLGHLDLNKVYIMTI